MNEADKPKPEQTDPPAKKPSAKKRPVKKRKPAPLRRLMWILLMLAALCWPLWYGIKTQRLEQAEKTLLLTVQKALQNYHVDQERYIPRETLSGHELLGVLSDTGFLDEPFPNNPWTGVPYSLLEGEPDRLRYQTDPSFETYSLQTLHRTRDEVTRELDSVDSTSLGD